jgi:hypothetical protein
MTTALTLPAKGENIGFFPDLETSTRCYKGYWQYRNGEEGGELFVDPTDATVYDYDGAFDLPRYIKEELKGHGITCPWD